ncbi:hypothetical protein GCM10010335_27550 [Streptomyces galbus]|nr:hypothetical protein GCM10010335_27550 [Streptomyces galbus]
MRTDGTAPVRRGGGARTGRRGGPGGDARTVTLLRPRVDRRGTTAGDADVNAFDDSYGDCCHRELGNR